MNNFEKTRKIVNAYVVANGSNTEMSRGEFMQWLQSRDSEINAQNVYPSDISFNRYNAGLKDFPGENLCLMYVEETDRYRLVGSDYIPNCEVFQYKKRSNEKAVGVWKNGKYVAYER